MSGHGDSGKLGLQEVSKQQRSRPADVVNEVSSNVRKRLTTGSFKAR